MNPWRKHRRQKLRRQNGGSYTECLRWINFSDIATVTVGPLVAGGPSRQVDLFYLIPMLLQRDDETKAEFIARAFGSPDFTKPRSPLHDSNEFYGLEDM
jgi:hypothetical protein